ncbi:MAG: hypothetical protein GXO07_03125 [Crenarchaeota archaeon]|nr:hypothetical protein [Thermoproteota archaeon]
MSGVEAARITYNVIIFGPWKDNEFLSLKNKTFRDRLIREVIKPSLDAKVINEFSEALNIKNSLLSVISFVPWTEPLPPPRFNVMSYLGLAWLAVVLDFYPSGAILESEFARNAGIPTLFVRLADLNGHLCYYDGICPNRIIASTEMLFSHVGSSFATVFMSRKAAECLAGGGSGGECERELREFRKAFKNALLCLARQWRRRKEVYECFRTAGAEARKRLKAPPLLDLKALEAALEADDGSPTQASR